MFKKSFITAIIALTPLFAFAASINFGDYFLKGAEVVLDDIYSIGGRTSTFVGSITGDAVAISRTIWSQSQIDGDALFLGEDVRVQGKVLDDARLIGGRIVTIDGKVFDDVVAIGSRVVVSPTGRIEGSLYAIGGEVEIQGTILGDAQVLSGKLLLTGAVEGNLELWGKATFKEPSRIGGAFIEHASGNAVPPLNVVITGNTILDEAERGSMEFPMRAILNGFFSLKVLMMLALGFLLFFLARERTEEVLLDTLPNFGARVLRGLIIIIIMPLATLLLFTTVVGIPIALLLFSLLLILMLLSSAYAGILLGALCERFVFKRSAFPISYRPILLGIVFLSILSLIPFVGLIIYGILFLGAVGSIGTLFFREVRKIKVP